MTRVDRQQEQTKVLIVMATAVSVVLVSQIHKPLWRLASAIVGRIHLQWVLLGANKDKEDSDKEDDIKVSGLYIHPGRLWSKRNIGFILCPFGLSHVMIHSCLYLPTNSSEIVPTRFRPTSHTRCQGICS